MPKVDLASWEEPASYKGHHVIWTGWKPHFHNCMLVGQWVAIRKDKSPKDRTGLYASCPGGKGTYKFGDDFDIDVRQDLEEQVLMASPPTNIDPAIQERAKRLTKDRLLRLLDADLAERRAALANECHSVND